jgi:hypothetical protein
MIDTDKYEGHAEGPWKIKSYNRGQAFTGINFNMTLTEKLSFTMKNGREKEKEATANLIADAPLLLEFIQKIVKEWNMPNKCNQEFGKDVRQLMYEYGLITFNEETRRYEVKE